MSPLAWAVAAAVASASMYIAKAMYELARTVRAERVSAKPANGSAGAQSTHYWSEQFGAIVQEKQRPVVEKLDRLIESHIRLSDAEAETQLAITKLCTVIDERLPRR